MKLPKQAVSGFIAVEPTRPTPVPPRPTPQPQPTPAPSRPVADPIIPRNVPPPSPPLIRPQKGDPPGL